MEKEELTPMEALSNYNCFINEISAYCKETLSNKKMMNGGYAAQICYKWESGLRDAEKVLIQALEQNEELKKQLIALDVRNVVHLEAIRKRTEEIKNCIDNWKKQQDSKLAKEIIKDLTLDLKVYEELISIKEMLEEEDE